VKPSRILLGALLAAAAGCSDSLGPGALSGDLSFSHSGAMAGTFTASGSILVTDPETSTWAAGVRDETNESITIAANVARPSSNTVDNIVIDFPQLTPGAVTVANGAYVVVAFGQAQDGTATWSCALSSGSVVVSSVSNGRVVGSFSGNGTCVDENGSPAAFTVTNGDFDVPLVDVSGL
jgi:hypothetical protein